MHKVPAAERRQRIEEMLEIVGLQQFADRKPQMLSGGQQQRVALARASGYPSPGIYCSTNPSALWMSRYGLKPVESCVSSSGQFGMTFIQVTHNQDEAYSLADQIVVMDHGRIDQVGTPQEIFSQPMSQFVASFTGDNNIFLGKVISAVEDTEGLPDSAQGTETGYFAMPGAAMPRLVLDAACCVRADHLHLVPLGQEAPSPQIIPIPRLTGRITAVEFTGYITRVSLVLEKNGAEILYKSPHHRLDATAYAGRSGDLIILVYSTLHFSASLGSEGDFV